MRSSRFSTRRRTSAGDGSRTGAAPLAFEHSDRVLLRLRLRLEVPERKDDRIGLLAVGEERDQVRDARLGAAEAIPVLGELLVALPVQLAQVLGDPLAHVPDAFLAYERFMDRSEHAASQPVLTDRRAVRTRDLKRTIPCRSGGPARRQPDFSCAGTDGRRSKQSRRSREGSVRQVGGIALGAVGGGPLSAAPFASCEHAGSMIGA
jgi:hypothetical protein